MMRSAFSEENLPKVRNQFYKKWESPTICSGISDFMAMANYLLYI